MNPNQIVSQTNSQEAEASSAVQLNSTVPKNLPTGTMPNSSDIKKVEAPASIPKVVSAYQGQSVESQEKPTTFSVLPAEFRGEALRHGFIKEQAVKPATPIAAPVMAEEQVPKAVITPQASQLMTEEKRAAKKKENIQGLEKPIVDKPFGAKNSNRLLLISIIALIVIFLIIALYFRVWERLPWFSQPDQPPVQQEPTAIPQASETDTDQDGLTDVQEESLGTDINNQDTDGDTLSDAWEVKFTLNPLSPGDAVLDVDNDGLTNVNEFKYGSDPNNADSDGDTYPDGLEVDNNYSPAEGNASRLEGGTNEPTTTPTPTPVTETNNPQSEDTTSGRDQKRKGHLKTIELALELYYDDNGSTYPDNLELLAPEYLLELPGDPLSPQYEYTYQRLTVSSYQLKAYLEQADDPDDLKDGQADHYYTLNIGN